MITQTSDDELSRHLNALIVRNIGDIEGAIGRTKEEIDSRLWCEMAAVVEDLAGKYGFRSESEPEEEDVWFAFDDGDWWKDDDVPEFGFSVSEISGLVDDTPQSWTARATANNPQGVRLGLFFWQKIFRETSRTFSRVLKEKADLLEHLPHTFLVEGNDIYLELLLDKETLAQAFEDDDFKAALEPLATAIETVCQQQEAFDELVAAIREAERKS